jgi:hypothetical protein
MALLGFPFYRFRAGSKHSPNKGQRRQDLGYPHDYTDDTVGSTGSMTRFAIESRRGSVDQAEPSEERFVQICSDLLGNGERD